LTQVKLIFYIHFVYLQLYDADELLIQKHEEHKQALTHTNHTDKKRTE
jgi:hypothetical protein